MTPLRCDSCDATPATAADGRNAVDADFGYVEGSDCPACDDGLLYVPDDLGSELDDLDDDETVDGDYEDLDDEIAYEEEA